MSYLIPRGTPVEIAEYGRHFFCPHTTKRDLSFQEPLAVRTGEFVFHDGYWEILVARAMVIEGSVTDEHGIRERRR